MKSSIKAFSIFIFEGALGLFVKRGKPVDRARVGKILVAEGGGIGDLLWTFPAIESLHANFPGAAISLLVSPSAKGVMELFPEGKVIGEVIEYDYSGAHRTLWQKFGLIRLLRGKRFDLVYSPDRGQGMRQESIMSFLSGARFRLGFRYGSAGSLNTSYFELREELPIVTQNLAVLEAAGLAASPREIRVSVPEGDLRFAKALLEEKGLHGHRPLVAVHPGAVWNPRSKSWSVERYAALFRILAERFNAGIIIVGSPGEKRINAGIEAGLTGFKTMNLTGTTTIARMAAVVSLSDLFIGNDSGPLQIALALKVPSVAVFGGTSPAQVLPPGSPCRVVRKDIPCSPCYIHQHDFQMPCKSASCLEAVTVDEVYQAAREMLGLAEARRPDADRD